MTIEPSGPQIQFLWRTKLVSKKWRRPKMMFTVPGGPQIQFLWNHILQIRAAGTNVRRSEPSGPQIQFLWRTKLVSKMWSGPKMMFMDPSGPQIQFLWKHILEIRAAGSWVSLMIAQTAGPQAESAAKQCGLLTASQPHPTRRSWATRRLPSFLRSPRGLRAKRRCTDSAYRGLLPATTCCCAICAAVRRPQVWILGWCSSFEQSDACMHVYMCVCSETASETAWNACLKNLS